MGVDTRGPVSATGVGVTIDCTGAGGVSITGPGTTGLEVITVGVSGYSGVSSVVTGVRASTNRFTAPSTGAILSGNEYAGTSDGLVIDVLLI